VFEGDEAGSRIHAGPGQPVGSLASQCRFADATEAVNDHQFAAQQMSLH
jgi:hypothetical protein